MRSYGPRRDPDGAVEHARVATAASYSRITTLYRRPLASGTVTCDLMRADTPARRIVRLTLLFDDHLGIETMRVRICDDELDEQRTLQRWERLVRDADARRPPSSPEAPGGGDSSEA